MKDLVKRCAGLDVHKDKMVALRDWIVQSGCPPVAMESTDIYWQPIYEILEDAFSGDITLLVVNARHMKNVSGKKTDMRDSEWIATLLRAGKRNTYLSA